MNERIIFNDDYNVVIIIYYHQLVINSVNNLIEHLIILKF